MSGNRQINKIAEFKAGDAFRLYGADGTLDAEVKSVNIEK